MKSCHWNSEWHKRQELAILWHITPWSFPTTLWPTSPGSPLLNGHFVIIICSHIPGYTSYVLLRNSLPRSSLVTGTPEWACRLMSTQPECWSLFLAPRASLHSLLGERSLSLPNLTPLTTFVLSLAQSALINEGFGGSLELIFKIRITQRLCKLKLFLSKHIYQHYFTWVSGH